MANTVHLNPTSVCLSVLTVVRNFKCVTALSSENCTDPRRVPTNLESRAILSIFGENDVNCPSCMTVNFCRESENTKLGHVETKEEESL